MYTNRPGRGLAILLLACLLSLAVGQHAFAHGANGTLQFSKTAVGPYYMSVWSEPAILRTGDVRFEAFVVDAAATPIEDCGVEIVLTPLDSDDAPIQLMTQQPETAVTSLTHEINYNLTEPGRYNVTVSIVEEAGEVGHESFEIEVTQVPTWIKIYMNTFIIVLVGFVLSLLIKGLSIFGFWKEATPVAKPAMRRPIR